MRLQLLLLLVVVLLRGGTVAVAATVVVVAVVAVAVGARWGCTPLEEAKKIGHPDTLRVLTKALAIHNHDYHSLMLV